MRMKDKQDRMQTGLAVFKLKGNMPNTSECAEESFEKQQPRYGPAYIRNRDLSINKEEL